MSDRIDLDHDQLARFARDGFLAIPSLTDDADVAFLRASYDRIFAQRAGREVGDQFDLAGTDEEGAAASLPQILRPALYAPEIQASRLLAHATWIARQLLGKEAQCEFAHAILKPPRHGAETPWHQDAAYWDPSFRYRSISIWVPLQEATQENGCMEFLPGSQSLDVLPHRSRNDDPRIHALELVPGELWRTGDSVACPLPAGGATIHGAYTLHHTGPNDSAIPRRALILNAGLAPERREHPLRFPWLEHQRTARSLRSKEAAARGVHVGAPPTGAVPRESD